MGASDVPFISTIILLQDLLIKVHPFPLLSLASNIYVHIIRIRFYRVCENQIQVRA